MRKDSQQPNERCKGSSRVLGHMCEGTPNRFSSTPLVVFDILLEETMQGHASVVFHVFVRQGKVARYGNQAVMSFDHGQQLKNFQCRFGTASSRAVSAVASLDLPYKAHLRCPVPTDLLANLREGLQAGSRRVAVSLFGSIDGVDLEIQNPICNKNTIDEVQKKSQIAICSQPLFLGPGLPARRIVEWIEYHRLLGVGHFYIYDREGALGSLLKKHIAAGVVTRYHWPIFEPNALKEVSYYDQHFAQDSCLSRHRNDHDWFLYLDPDEFSHVTPPKGKALSTYLTQLEKEDPSIAQIMVQNLLLAGPPVPGKSLLVEQFVTRASITVPWRQKPLIHGASVEFLWAHFASRLRCGATVMAHPMVLRANHYMAADGRLLKDKKPDTEDLSATWVGPLLAHRMAEWDAGRVAARLGRH